MTPSSWIGLFCIALACFGFGAELFYRRGWIKGAQWAMRAEKDVEEARQQIWREEPKEGQWL